MKSKFKKRLRWVLIGYRTGKIYGRYATKQKAHNAACLDYEPNCPMKEAKKDMPLHYERDANGEVCYLIWDETFVSYWETDPLFYISEEYLNDTVEKPI